MKKIHADQGPQLTMEVSERERAIAKAAKKEFKDILKSLDKALDVIYDLRDAIVKQRPSQEDLQKKYKGRLLRYRRKIAEIFNGLLEKLKKAIQSLSDISDPDMIHLKKIIISEFDELSDGVEGVMDLLNNPDREGFTKNLERLSTQLQRRYTSISEIVDNQLFDHLEHDILGKMKISSLKARIRRRTRIFRKIAMENDSWDL